jgi:antagonist of KipI
MTGALVAVAPGLLTTIQDLGRPGHARHGVSAAGAADALSLRIANRLAGNPDDAAGLEMTLLGGTFRFETGTRIALAGADMEATLDGRPIPPWAACDVGPGQLLVCGAARGGMRSCLAVHGGIAVEPVLGSRSTHMPSRLGGLEGRALRKNDRLPIGAFPDGPVRGAKDGAAAGATLPEPRRLDDAALAALPRPVAPPGTATLRLTDGVHADRFASEARQRLFDATYKVSPTSNRMGLRLEGPGIAPLQDGEIISEGMPLGAVQIPSGGDPIILFVDHQTTGGYPVIGCVISADLPRIAQLRPRDAVRFEPIAMAAARALLLEQEAWLDRLLPPSP